VTRLKLFSGQFHPQKEEKKGKQIVGICDKEGIE